MNVGEIIEYVDMVEPNGFDAAVKIAWIRDLDMKVRDEIILRHEGAPAEAWSPPHDINDILLIPEPYARDIYEYYLRGKIAAANLEDVRYNQHSIMFNAAYLDYAKWYKRNHLPLKPTVGSRYRF